MCPGMRRECRGRKTNEASCLENERKMKTSPRKACPVLGLEACSTAVKILESGGVVVVPTDTVYGVAAHPARPAAVKRLYEAKQRDIGKPLPLLADSGKGVTAFGARLGPVEMRLADRFWPGPLTLVLDVSQRDVDLEGAQQDTEGFRVPDHGPLRELLRMCGGVLRVSSANRSGRNPAVSAAEAVEALGKWVDLVLDGGAARGGVPSSVVRVEGCRCVVLREGAISNAELQAVAGARGGCDA